MARGRRGAGRNRGRVSTRATSPAAVESGLRSRRREPTDEDMADAPSESAAATPPPDEDEPEEVEEAEDDPDAFSAPPSPVAEADTSLPTPRRRPGRPPKRPQNFDADSRTPSETPKRRGGFRGGNAWRGGRWKNRGGQGHAAQTPVDQDGNPAEIVNDEVKLPEDPDGETKVDKDGCLQGGRKYRVRTFTVSGKENRLYMLSTEPARCIGFRDSYLFFQKHPRLYKIIVSDEAKKDLIERDLIPHSYKGRLIGVVTARSVFREFGAKIIIGGKKIVDDYDVVAARAAGGVEGELAVPDDIVPVNEDEYDRNRYVAWHGASAVYHSGVPSVPQTAQAGATTKRRQVKVTGANWMLEHAKAASQFNSRLTAMRAANRKGVYDVYTNMMHYPASMQHTHARWEEVYPPSFQPPALVNSTSALSATPSSELPPTPTSVTDTLPTQSSLSVPKNTPALSPYLYNNAMTVDTVIAAPPSSTFGIPGPDGTDAWDIGPKGLCDVSQEVIDELPPECLGPFLEARAEEAKWRDSWGRESGNGGDGQRWEGRRGY